MNLPVELIVRILCDLDLKALHICMLISRGFSRIIKESAVLQYHLELLSEGFIDGDEHTHLSSVSSRHQRLLDLQKSWFELHPRKKSLIEEGYRCTLYKAADGMWARGYGVRDDDGPHVWLHTLPSITTGRAADETSHTQKLENLSDFVVDPSQDLLILEEELLSPNGVTYRFHLRAMSQNTRHPEAHNDFLEYALPSYTPAPHLDEYSIIQISENLILILFLINNLEELERSVLVMWNWRTGKLLTTHDGDQQVISSFALVTPKLLMLSEYYPPRNSADEWIQEYDPCPCLTLLEIVEQPDATSKLKHAQTLLFPRVDPYHTWEDRTLFISDFTIRADPAPMDWKNNSTTFHSPFHSDPSHRIFVITLKINLIDGLAFEDYNFSICIPQKTIIGSLDRGTKHSNSASLGSPGDLPPAKAHEPYDPEKVYNDGGGDERADYLYQSLSGADSSTSEADDLIWEEWGEDGACIATTRAETNVCGVYGTRWATLNESGTSVIVSDFSPYVVEKARRSGLNSQSAGQPSRSIVQDSPADLTVCQTVFDLVSVGNLPRVETTLKLGGPAGSVFMDMDHILLVKGEDIEVWAM
ncbi:hypothetical protein SISNIDRAFT_324835 [Sistotremastrum niveocremeum HHB9708]|uniref:F-box domain-containing protein n=1 Tax=Sistotremastrum niveocremeum HHB9708 TaxID=1314777 RepID=A0A164X873_9AGAM|nr:hypothetical protein SISNIDRAFT_324835 [Sistotremastrum niveocremeum HHB9708]